MRWFVLIFSLTAAAAIERPLPFFAAGDLTPYWQAENAKVEPATVRGIHFHDQDGKPISERELNGHVSVVNFFFAECGATCPAMMHQIQGLLPVLRGARVYSVSVDSGHDSTHELLRYAHRQNLDLRQWSLLTGTRAELRHLSRQIFKVESPTGGRDLLHSSHLYLLDDHRRLRGVYDALRPAELTLLESDLASL